MTHAFLFVLGVTMHCMLLPSSSRSMRHASWKIVCLSQWVCKFKGNIIQRPQQQVRLQVAGWPLQPDAVSKRVAVTVPVAH